MTRTVAPFAFLPDMGILDKGIGLHPAGDPRGSGALPEGVTSSLAVVAVLKGASEGERVALVEGAQDLH